MVDTTQPELDSKARPSEPLPTEGLTKTAPPRPQKRRLSPVPAILALALSGGLTYYLRHRGKAGDETQYRVAVAQVQDVRRTVSASGVIEPWTTVDIKSKAGGRIDQLLVDIGDRVHAGQVIARIDPTDSALTYNQAEADTASATAKESQSADQYRLQVAQTQLSIAQARSQVSAAQAAVAAAEARLATARHESAAQPSLSRAAISAAQAALDSVRQDRAQLDATQPQDLAAAKSTLDQATANMMAAKLVYERKGQLAEKGYVAIQEVDDAKAAYAVSRAQVEAAKARVDRLGDQQRAAVAAANAKVRQAEAQLRNAKVQSVTDATKQDAVREANAAAEQAAAQLLQAQTQLRQAIANGANDAIRQLDIASARAARARAQASLSNAKTTLDQTVVRAPSDGVVLQKYVEQGTIITSGLSFNSTGTSIVQIGEVSRLYVDVAVDETDVASVHEGQRVDVSVDAYPNVAFVGKVVKISPRAEVDQNVTSVHVRVELSNQARGFGRLKPTMNATCDFIIADRPSVIAIPADAIHPDGGRSYVSVAVGGKPAASDPKLGLTPDASQLVGVKTIRRIVTTGLEGNETVEITSGLQAGERVVLDRIAPTSSTTSQRSSPFGSGPPMGGARMGGGSRGGR